MNTSTMEQVMVTNVRMAATEDKDKRAGCCRDISVQLLTNFIKCDIIFI